MSVRINKYLSEVGYCSRRVADRLIEEGKVKINGKVPVMGTKVEEGDNVEIDLAREIYERLLSKGWRKIEKNWN